MNEHELRLMVREAVSRHLGGAAPSPHLPIAPLPHCPTASFPDSPISHASHILHAGLVNVTDACVIEPAVACDHCGYCKSHGH
jgi:hypothetical protein